MAAKGNHIENYFMNWTKSCTLGHPPEYRNKIAGRSSYDSLKPWEKPQFWPNGEWCFVPPGAVWNDSANTASVIASRPDQIRFFVQCSDENELKIIQESLPDRVGDIVRDDTGALRGFYGFFAVMRDVTRQHSEIVRSSVNLLASEGHVQELSKKAKAHDAAVDDAAKSKLEAELLKKQLEDLKRELNAEKAMSALKKGK
jgi:hypothetical protein